MSSRSTPSSVTSFSPRVRLAHDQEAAREPVEVERVQRLRRCPRARSSSRPPPRRSAWRRCRRRRERTRSRRRTVRMPRTIRTPNRRQRRGTWLTTDVRRSTDSPDAAGSPARRVASREAGHRRDVAREAAMPHGVGAVRRDLDVEDRVVARRRRPTRPEARACSSRRARPAAPPAAATSTWSSEPLEGELHHDLPRELREEALVALEEQAQVRETVEQQRDAVEPEAEREPRVLLRIDARRPQDERMHHAGAHDLDPAGLLALAAARALAEDAAHRDVHARLDERERTSG